MSTNNANTCGCSSCAGTACPCGCQNETVTHNVGCSCGEPCPCGESCPCGDGGSCGD